MSGIGLTKEVVIQTQSLIKRFKDFEQFEKLKKSLDTGEGVKNVEKTTSEHWDMGCFYDLSEDRQKSMKLDVTCENITRQDKQKFLMTGPIFNTNSDGSQTCFIYITYEDYKESLDIKETSYQPNIKDSIYCHFVSSRIMGFQAVIELVISKDYSGPDFKGIVDILLGKATLEEGLDLSQIVFSVSGNLPLDLKYDCSTLHEKSLKSLQSLCSAKFYESQENRFLLRVGISPLNLECYFSPLFEKLIELNEIQCSERFTSPEWIISCIKRVVLQKILSAGELIKSGELYLQMSQFLQTLYRSVLLNREEMELLINSLNEVVTKEVANLQSVKYMNRERPHTEDFTLTVLYKISLSLDKHQNLLKQCIAEFFETNGKEKYYQNKMVKLFEESLQEDCATTRQKVEDKDVMRCKWQEELGKNVKINCDVTTSSCFIDATQFEVKLCSGGVPIDPQLPVLHPPSNIEKLEATDNSIRIAWTISEDIDSTLVRFYRIDYRRVIAESEGRWHTIFTENQEVEATVDDLQSGGSYVFRVQAWFLDFVGVWSENSEQYQTQTKASYSAALKVYIGQSLAEMPNIGPVVALNEDGSCCFQQRHDYPDYWSNIVYNSNQFIGSRPILLSDELNGIIVLVFLTPYSGWTFYVNLVAPQCQINQQKVLPISLNLQVKIALNNGGYFTSPNHKFTINSLDQTPPYISNFAQPHSFLVTPYNTRGNNQPEIILQFTN